MDLKNIKAYLKEMDVDGWLIADFHGRNTVGMEIMGVTGHTTRRALFFVPTFGEPIALLHAIEQAPFAHLPGDKEIYSSYVQLEEKLANILSNSKKIAMEYTPMGRLPVIGLVDAGTIELIRSFGCDIVSSENLVAKFLAVLSAEQIESHKKAAIAINQAKDDAFALIKNGIENSKPVTEFEVTQFLMKRFEENNMETDHAPICGVNGNAGNPHYSPTLENCSTIDRGDLVLIDLWAKFKDNNSVFADITWMGFCGTKEEIPQKYVDIFAVLTRARDMAVEFANENLPIRAVVGGEIDDVVRNHIVENGFGEYFIHRTGHSITTDVHGTGPNIDNQETSDSRYLQSGHLFSIEPGIYMKDCGFRTEIDVLVHGTKAEVHTQPVQSEILPLF